MVAIVVKTHNLEAASIGTQKGAIRNEWIRLSLFVDCCAQFSSSEKKLDSFQTEFRFLFFIVNQDPPTFPTKEGGVEVTIETY